MKQIHLKNGFLREFRESRFLFSELVKRDFKKKYKNTYLGMLWSVLSPLLTLLVMRIVFTRFFGRTQEHYTTYLFAGNLIFSFFSEATGGGMGSILGNAHIFTKVNVPKYLFLLSRAVSSLINFSLTLCVFFVFCMFDRIRPAVSMLLLPYPILCLILFTVGVGLLLASLFVFFRDMQYLWSVFTMLLMYLSAIFYTVNTYPSSTQKLFLLNPIYVYIKYVREIVIDGVVPGITTHLLAAFYAALFLSLGIIVYKKTNKRFIYYV